MIHEFRHLEISTMLESSVRTSVQPNASKGLAHDKCLALVTYNEEKWLRLHLPVLTRTYDYDLFVLDLGSTDNSAGIAEDYGAVVVEENILFNWQKSFQRLLELARLWSYRRLVRLDPDELMFTDDIIEMFNLLTDYSVVDVNRYNFEVDREHYCPELYPDLQTRGIRLDRGIKFGGTLVHTTIDHADSRIHCPHINVFHYEGLAPMWERKLRAMNKEALLLGEPLISREKLYAAQGHKKYPPRHNIQFTGSQPALFNNKFAPYEESNY